jgi:hypothetical protein
MSNLVYIKSQNDVININNNINPDGLYQFTLFPFNGRAVPVSKIVVDKINNTVTFNDNIRYNGTSNTVSVNAGSIVINNYFGNYSGERIYRNNLYESVMSDIVNKTINLNDPTTFLMYGYSGEQTIVTSIVDSQTHYRFTSSLGSIDFDKNTGVPLRTTIGNDTSEELRFVVYKYDGYSHITTDYYNFVIDKLKEISPTGFIYVHPFIDGLNVFIVHSQRKTENKSHKIMRDFTHNNINYPLIFFAPYKDNNNNWSDEGISFNNAVADRCINYFPSPFNWVLHGTAPCPYRIYRKNFFSNFSNIASIYTAQQAKDLIISYQPWVISPTNNLRLSYSPSIFRITIPNDKPTNRILVYQQGTNKLLHITDWIAKGTTQNVTINYTDNGVLNVTSSVIPVNPLPVPNFNVLDTGFTIADDGKLKSVGLDYEINDEKYYEDSPSFISTQTWSIIRQNDKNCTKGQILNSDASRCGNIYSDSITPIKSISYDVNNGTEPVLNNNGTSVNCGQGVITNYTRRGYGYRSCGIRGGSCTRTRYPNRFYKTKCARLSIE